MLGGSERATVVTDVVILLPVLLTMIAGMFMLGTRISDYMFLNASARELGMILSKIPHMHEVNLGVQEGETVLFWINLGPTDPENNPPLNAAAVQACLNAFASPDYPGCFGGNSCGCALAVALWYATELLRSKSLMLHTSSLSGKGLSVEVGYNARIDPLTGLRDNASGLCFISVKIYGEHYRWPFVGGGQISAEAHVPYVSEPVHWNGGRCRQTN